MKKTNILFLLLILAAFALSACAPASTPQATPTTDLTTVTTAPTLIPNATASPTTPSNTPESTETTEPSQTEPKETADATAITDEEATGEKIFTLEELAAFTGKEGNPAYVAVKGIVYDVTNVPSWANGEHKNGLTAGKDATNEIKQSLHGEKVLESLPIVGKLE